MSIEEAVLEKLRQLPVEKQREVLDFAEFLHQRGPFTQPRRSPEGLWADLGFHVTEDDIAEARKRDVGQLSQGRHLMAAVVADTHVVIWHLLQAPDLSPDARSALRAATRLGAPIYVSSISMVEVTYLVEKGRVPPAALVLLDDSLRGPNPGFALVPLDAAVAQTVRTIPRHLIPEMPDRIIAATAVHLAVPIVTRDLRIQGAGIPTIW